MKKKRLEISKSQWNQEHILWKKINKIHESLVDLKRKNEKIKTINIKNQRRHITTDPTDIKEIIRKLYSLMWMLSVTQKKCRQSLKDKKFKKE